MMFLRYRFEPDRLKRLEAVYRGQKKPGKESAEQEQRSEDMSQDPV